MNYNGFEKIRMYGWRLWLSRDFGQNEILSLAEEIDGVDGCRSDFVKVPSSLFANVFRCRVSFKSTVHSVYLKQYFYRSRWDFVKHLFRPGRGRRDFRASLMLQSNGFNTPEIIAFGEKRIGFCCRKTFLITGELKTARPIHQVVAYIGRKPGGQWQADRKEFISSFGRTIGQMHNAGIFHGDLRLGNILAEKGDDGWRFFFIDNERTKKYSHIPLKLRRKNLVQLNMIGGNVSERDRLQFFASYISQDPSIRLKSKELLEVVIQKTAKRKGVN